MAATGKTFNTEDPPVTVTDPDGLRGSRRYPMHLHHPTEHMVYVEVTDEAEEAEALEKGWLRDAVPAPNPPIQKIKSVQGIRDLRADVDTKAKRSK